MVTPWPGVVLGTIMLSRFSIGARLVPSIQFIKSNVLAYPKIRDIAFTIAATFRTKSRLVAEKLCLRQLFVVPKRRQVRFRLYDKEPRKSNISL
jgi:hypothetical protein